MAADLCGGRRAAPPGAGSQSANVSTTANPVGVAGRVPIEGGRTARDAGG